MNNEGKYECVTSFHFEIDEPVIFLLPTLKLYDDHNTYKKVFIHTINLAQTDFFR